MSPKQFNIHVLFLALLLTNLSTFTSSCNSYTLVDTRAEKSIAEYEAATSEIINQFDKILKINGRDSSFKGSMTITNDNILPNINLDLKLTRKLCRDSLAEYIFLGTDSSICFNLKNSDGSNIYRHFIIFQRKTGHPDFDFMMTHSYKVIDRKRLKANWTYVIIKQFFD